MSISISIPNTKTKTKTQISSIGWFFRRHLKSDSCSFVTACKYVGTGHRLRAARPLEQVAGVLAEQKTHTHGADCGTCARRFQEGS